jgi:hypothetical protein
MGIAAMHLNVDFVPFLLQKKADPSIGLDLLTLGCVAKSMGVKRKPICGIPLY